MYTTNTKAGLSAVRRIPAPETVTSGLSPGTADRFVSMGGGWRPRACPNSCSRQELGGAGTKIMDPEFRRPRLFRLIQAWGGDCEQVAHPAEVSVSPGVKWAHCDDSTG